ncbi:MAG TPA: PstS family phosphate ABC transporter substrate-binding protein [Polyangiaceae bacterium]
MSWLLALVLGSSLVACSRETRQSRGKGAGEPSSVDAKRVTIQNKGSDTLVNVAQTWAEAYAKIRPETPVAVSGGGTGTGVSALINRTADIVNASRELTRKELEMAKQRGIDPRARVVGHDAVVIFVHKNNPKKQFSLAELVEIYGEGGRVERWSDLGVQVPGCPSDEVVLISRQNNSGTYEYFKQAILGKTRELRLGSRDLHGSKDVVDLIAKTPCAIGYSGLAYSTDNVHMACIRKDGACVAPTVNSALDGSYPIARPLFMVTDGKPEGAVADYLSWIETDAGQCIIARQGYAPVRPLKC